MCIYLHNRIALTLDINDTPSASNDLISQAIINCEELNINRQYASQAFTLWMSSPFLGKPIHNHFLKNLTLYFLELQLKPTHKPFQVRQNWKHIVEQFSHASHIRQQRDEPILTFQRNVFFPQHIEEKIK